MKVLLTGASGFLGSHILDQLRSRRVATAVLLRPTSDRRFIGRHLPELEIRTGSIDDRDSLQKAVEGVTHVIHCAGCIKAAVNSEFFRINQGGTSNLVSAVNAASGTVKQFLHVSSLAAAGPAPAAKPARETDPPRPVSEYGKSKLAAELEVVHQCRVPYTIVRPPAVYGPRDVGFLSLFKAVQNHILPRPSASQALSLVYAPDLAEAILRCLDLPGTAGRTYFVAHPEIVTGRRVAGEIAAQLNTWTIPCPLPPLALWPVCLIQELFSRATGRPMLLSLQKFAELRAEGWVCDPAALKLDTGYECATTLRRGIAETLRWYRENHWIKS